MAALPRSVLPLEGESTHAAKGTVGRADGGRATLRTRERLPFLAVTLSTVRNFDFVFQHFVLSLLP